MLKCRMVALELSADTISFLLPRIKDLAPSVTFTPVEIAFLIEKGYLQYGFEWYDVTREIQEYGVAYIEHIIRDIQGEFQTHVGMHADYDRVLMIGGGAAFLKNALPARNFEVIVRPEPEYANARGFQTLTFAKGVMPLYSFKHSAYAPEIIVAFERLRKIRKQATFTHEAIKQFLATDGEGRC